VNDQLIRMIMRGIVATAEDATGVKALRVRVSLSSSDSLVKCRWVNSRTGKHQSLSTFAFDLTSPRGPDALEMVLEAVEYLSGGIGSDLPIE